VTSFFYYTPLKKGGDHITQLSEREKAVTQIFDRYNKKFGNINAGKEMCVDIEKDREERVKWIYTSSNNKELEERYDQWAKDYDTDLDEGFWIYRTAAQR